MAIVLLTMLRDDTLFEESLRQFVSHASSKSLLSSPNNSKLEIELRFHAIDQAFVGNSSGKRDQAHVLSEERFADFCSAYQQVCGVCVWDTAKCRVTQNTLFATDRTDTVVRKVELLASVSERSSRQGYFETKQTLHRDDGSLKSEFGVRGCISKETVVMGAAAKALVADPNPLTVRKLIRCSTMLENHLCLDVSKVVDASDDKKILSCEIELEMDPRFLEAGNGAEKFVRAVRKIWLALHRSRLLFSASSYRSVRSFLAESLRNASGQSHPSIVRHMSRPRNVKLHEISAGSLLLNPKFTYSATIKADGKRCFLVQHGVYLWVCFALDRAFLVDRFSAEHSNRVVFDAEWIPKEKVRNLARAEASVICLVFDTVYRAQSAGSQKHEATFQDLVLPPIDKQPHSRRLAYLDEWLACIQPVSAFVRTSQIRRKPFHRFSTLSELSAACRASLADTTLDDEVSFENDGLIFMPDEAPYYLQAFTMPLHQRNIANFPDVVKWKPKEKLTVDLLIQDRRVFAKGMTEFVGTKFGTWSGRLVEQRFSAESDAFEYDVVDPGQYHNVVVECSMKQGLTRDTIDLVVEVVRRDRDQPNSIEVIVDTWNDWIRPVEAQTIFDEDKLFQMIRQEQSRQKTMLYELAKAAIPVSAPSCLVDLGSGRGGDISKWSSVFGDLVDTVVACEPDKENLAALDSRAQRSRLPFRLFQCCASVQQVDQIEANLVVHGVARRDVRFASLMLVASFLANPDGSDFRKLADCVDRILADDGVFIVYTLSGQKVRRLFSSGADSAQLGPVVFESIGDCRLGVRWTSGTEDEVILHDGYQEEWLVDVPLLLSVFADRGYSVVATLDQQGSTDPRAFSVDGCSYLQLFEGFVLGKSTARAQALTKPVVSKNSLQKLEKRQRIESVADVDDVEREQDRVQDLGQMPLQKSTVCAVHVDAMEMEVDEEDFLPCPADDTKSMILLSFADNIRWKHFMPYQWNLVRIACMSGSQADPVSFWHALAKAVCIDYQTVSSAGFRRTFVYRWIAAFEQSAKQKRCPKVDTKQLDLVTDIAVLRKLSDVIFEVLQVRVCFLHHRAILEKSRMSQSDSLVSCLSPLFPLPERHSVDTPIVFVTRLSTSVEIDLSNRTVVPSPDCRFVYELVAIESKEYNLDHVKPIHTMFRSTDNFARFVFAPRS